MTTRKLVLVDLWIQILQKDNLVCFPDNYGIVIQKLFTENQWRSFISCWRDVFSFKDISKNGHSKTQQEFANTKFQFS